SGAGPVGVLSLHGPILLGGHFVVESVMSPSLASADRSDVRASLGPREPLTTGRPTGVAPKNPIPLPLSLRRSVMFSFALTENFSDALRGLFTLSKVVVIIE